MMPMIPQECGLNLSGHDVVFMDDGGTSVAFYMDSATGRAALAAYCVTVLEWLIVESWKVFKLGEFAYRYAWAYQDSLKAWRDEWKRYGRLP